jgi:dUTP pyrophosphatase
VSYHSNCMDLPIKRFDKKFPLPAPTHRAACFDLICRETVTIPPHEIRKIYQNVAVKVPDGCALLVFSRSSTPLKKGLMVANGVGVVDPFYCGEKDEILALFINFTDEPVTVEAGDKIAQGMIIKTEPVTWQEVDAMHEEGHGGYHH